MAEIITCPACQKKLQVPDELLGQSVQCPDCKHPFLARVESFAANPPPPTPAAERPRDESPRPRYDDTDDDDVDVGPSRRPRPPNRGAIILTLGIITLVLFGTCLVPLILGPIAWIMGNRDLAAIRSGEMDSEGEGMIQAGRILGIVGFVLGLLVAAFWCVYVGIIALFVAAVGANAPQKRRM